MITHPCKNHPRKWAQDRGGLCRLCSRAAQATAQTRPHVRTCDYETVWNGASWRDDPQPHLGPPLVIRTDPRQKPTSRSARVAVADVNRTVLRAAFTAQWQSVSQLATAASMTPQGVRVHIKDAVIDGVCESQLVKSKKQWGRSERQYRVSA